MHDRDTNASQKDVVRWCMVVAIVGRTVRLAPRSASIPAAVFSPMSNKPEFTADGWFGRWSATADLADVQPAQNIGQLPDPERARILSLHQHRSTL